ncbi:MAG: S8 family peptidase [Tetrasphaera sp.]
MPHSPLRLKVAAATAGAAVLPLASLAASTPTAAAPAADTARTTTYIVMTDDSPLASFNGGSGFERTKPADGERIDTRTTNARAYTRHLVERHDAALRSAGISTAAKRSDYTVAFNGFSAKLTSAQAAKLKKTAGVAHVWENETRYADTISTPDFLGLTGTNGVWAKQFRNKARAGLGIIVGDLDSGIWPENPSFAALPEPRPDWALINRKWRGACVSGTEEPVPCNNKLIGARYYTENNTINSFEFNSPRDYNGHGSHTASTAAGNNGVQAVINGGVVGTASGMAPVARLAAYKVLWATTDGRASGSTEGIVHAIDDAVADGVDVINYSISGSRTYIVGPDEIAFLGAADAGVFVSTSAGNDGDAVGTSSVAHNAPWTTTVAASTHDRGSTNTVTLGNGSTYPGVGVSPTGVGPAPLINSTAAAAAGADPNQATLCYGTADGGLALDPAKVNGKIVICTRGTTARVNKSAAVQEAGGIGMILANNTDAESLNADFHSVPTSHVNGTDGAAIKAYVASATNPTATISPRNASQVRAPQMAGFSSYGPALAGGGDLLKPDITAPGVDVIAAVSPAGDAGGNNFNANSGTSMSAPHISGLAALLIQKHPNWQPMWIKSAMMTTATTKDNTGAPIQRAGHDATPLDYGNGHVVPKSMFNPGLVYGNRQVDWYKYGCAIGQFQLVTSASFCQTYGGTDPSNFNYPSIAVNDVAGSRQVKRLLTNVTGASSTYKGKISVPGFTARLSAASLTIGAQKTKPFTMTFTRTTAPLDQWAFGSLTWTDTKGHVVRSSIALKPVVVGAPAEVTGTGTSGSKPVTVSPGYTGTLSSTVAGLEPATVNTTTTPKGAATTVTVTIPAGTKVARFATYDADYPSGTDVDLVVRRGTTTVGSSGGATAEEAVNLSGSDVGGTYTVQATYFAGTPATLDIQVNSFAVGTTDEGNLTVSPASGPVTTGQPVTRTFSWSGLSANTRYLGYVTWTDGTNPIGRTLVAILK